MNFEPTISVIVPVYNVEKYLKECIDSIINQTYSKLEIIFINDGSTDNSLNILDKYAKIDKRIKVITTENKGPAAARQRGLDLSQGDWVSFIDSDDTIDKIFYAKAVSLIEEGVNIIKLGVNIIFEDECLYNKAEIEWYNRLDVNGKLKITDQIKKNINVELWNKVFRKSIFDEFDIRFKSGTAFEDVDILMKALSVSKYIKITNEVLYCYRRRAGSYVSNFNVGINNENCSIERDSLDVIYRLFNFYVKHNILEKNYHILLYLTERNYNYVVGSLLYEDKLELQSKLSSFLEDNISDEVINKYCTNTTFFHDAKKFNSHKPFYSRQLNEKDIKIFVSYHRRTLLPPEESIYQPLHCGRSLASIATSKDGRMDIEDYNWMLQNMIGDNSGNHISEKNRLYSELTAMYWMWKNYDVIGNPKYIGLAHYRRCFNFYGIESLSNADICIAEAWNCGTTVLQQYLQFHRQEDLDATIEILEELYPEYVMEFKNVLNGCSFNPYNMFIMKKNFFIDYANWLFTILQKLEEKIDWSYRSYVDLRILGNISERLQKAYINKKIQDGVKVMEISTLFLDEVDIMLQKTITPKFARESSVVVTSFDDNYALYGAVMLSSLIKSLGVNKKCEIYILDGGISEVHKNKILGLLNDNIYIYFVDMRKYNLQYSNLFLTNTHFTVATYYRFFIPEIFKNFEKIIYLDPDLIIETDISELYATDVQHVVVAASRDPEAHRVSVIDAEFSVYFRDVLKINNPYNYFQAGVLVCNIEAMKQFEFTQKCLQKLKEVKTPKWVDQDILNSVLQGRVAFLDYSWNILYFLFLNNNYILRCLDSKTYDKIINYNKYHIIHFCGGIKPWNEPQNELTDIWWKYARMTPFYEEILFNNFKNQNIVQQVALPKYSLLHRVKSYCNRNLNHNSHFYTILRTSYIFIRSIWRKLKNIRY